MTTATIPAQRAAVRRATRTDTNGWAGMTLADLRVFLADCDRDGVDPDACLIAVTDEGTAQLRGVGFFSLG